MTSTNTIHTFIPGLHKRRDAVVLVFIVALSSLLLLEKFYFLFTVFSEQLSFVTTLQLLIANLSSFLALWLWVYLLLKHQSSTLMNAYVLLSSFILFIFLRTIQSGEITTRQGVDYYLVEHLMLMVFGHEAWKFDVLLWFIRLHIFMLFLLPVLFCLKQLKKEWLSGFFLAALFVLSFFPFSFKGIPASLAQNSLIYVVKSAWLSHDATSTTENAPELFTPPDQHNSETTTVTSTNTKNVVIIILESTGANMLDFYNPEMKKENATPFLSEFATQALVFTDTSAVMTSTTKSLVSILCGIEPYIGLESFDATQGIPVDCLPKRLSQAGYQSAYFQSAHEFYERRDLLVKHMGFDEFFALESIPDAQRKGFKRSGIFGYEDRILLNHNQTWLEQAKAKGKPFMATYLTLAQHHPYYSPQKDHSRIGSASHRYKNNFIHSLRYVDAYLKELVEQYRAAGLYEDTLFVVLGDHGESFGFKHPQRFHNNTLYREGIWVPFFLVNPTLFPELQHNHSLRSLMDVAPTLEHLLGLDVLSHDVSSKYRGVSAFSDKSHQQVFSACWYKERCLAVSDADYKYIYNFNDAPEELYARKHDFWEQQNLAEQHPLLLEAYRQSALQWYAQNQQAYENFYRSRNEHFREEPESYYRFPISNFTDKLRIRY